MLHWLWVFIIGLIVGLFAKMFMPGKEPGGIFITAIIGIVGSLIGGWLASLLGFGVGATASGAGMGGAQFLAGRPLQRKARQIDHRLFAHLVQRHAQIQHQRHRLGADLVKDRADAIAAGGSTLKEIPERVPYASARLNLNCPSSEHLAHLAA